MTKYCKKHGDQESWRSNCEECGRTLKEYDESHELLFYCDDPKIIAKLEAEERKKGRTEP